MSNLEVFLKAKATISDQVFGFCMCLERAGFGQGMEYFTHLMKLWPESTGCRFYPVPSPDLHHAEAFGRCPAGKYFDPSTEYGRSRLAMVEWMGEYLLEEHRI